MADGRLAKFRDFPIRMYVDAILERDPGKCLLYKSVYDYNDSESQANQRSMSNHIVPVETNVPESSEVEKTGQEIVVYQEPIEHSDDCETSSQNDTDSDFEISEDSDDELQDDAAVFEVETVKEHVTTSKRISVQPAKALELEIPKVNETGVKTDKDYDTSRTISDIPARLGNVSRCPNGESVDGGVNNNENNVPVDDANSGKRVNQIKEKKRVLLTQIKKYLEGSKNKSDKPCVPKVNSGKRCGSKARRTIDVEDDDFPSRKRKANNIDLNKKAKEINFKKPRFDEAETSKRGASRRKPVVVLALEENKQKSRANKDDSFINAEKVDKSLCLADGEIGAHKTKEPVFCGLLRGSVPSGSKKMQKVVKVDDPRIDVMKPLKRGAKDDVDENDRLVSATKLPKALHLADDNSAADKCKASGTFGGFKPLGEAIKKNPVKSDELRLDVAKLLYRGPEKLKSKAEENDRFASDRETGTDKSSYGFGGLLRFEPSGSLAVVHAGQAKKQKGVQAKDIGADKGKASGLLRVLEPSGSRSGLGRVDEVKEQKAAAKAIEPWVDLVKETNNGPKWHAKCKESGVCSWLGKCGPSSS